MRVILLIITVLDNIWINNKSMKGNYTNNAPPMKYSYRTRIGNWSEEWDLDEIK